MNIREGGSGRLLFFLLFCAGMAYAVSGGDDDGERKPDAGRCAP